jgi:hypothetical protein
MIIICIKYPEKGQVASTYIGYNVSKTSLKVRQNQAVKQVFIIRLQGSDGHTGNLFEHTQMFFCKVAHSRYDVHTKIF